MQGGSISSYIHYHIRWSDSSLDWKSFPTKEEATKLAEHIKKPNETFVIVERYDDCERCEAFKSQSNIVGRQKDQDCKEKSFPVLCRLRSVGGHPKRSINSR